MVLINLIKEDSPDVPSVGPRARVQVRTIIADSAPTECRPYPKERRSYPKERHPYPKERHPYPKERHPYPKERRPYPKERHPYPTERRPYWKERGSWTGKLWDFAGIRVTPPPIGTARARAGEAVKNTMPGAFPADQR